MFSSANSSPLPGMGRSPVISVFMPTEQLPTAALPGSGTSRTAGRATCGGGGGWEGDAGALRAPLKLSCALRGSEAARRYGVFETDMLRMMSRLGLSMDCVVKEVARVAS